MPLVWSDVIEKYRNGFKVPTITGGKFLQISTVDGTAIHIENPVWTSELERVHLEKAVQLIEEGVISTDPGLFVEDYMIYVSSHRATSVAHIMRDLGYIEKTGTFSVRC